MGMKRRTMILSCLILCLFLAGCAQEIVGARWYYGTCPEQGRPGDFYVDTDDYILYQMDEDGVWNIVMENFGRPVQDGQDGTAGTDGKDGAVWYYGLSCQSCPSAKPGDFYLDTDDYVLYALCADLAWTKVMENFGKPGEATGPAQIQSALEEKLPIITDSESYDTFYGQADAAEKLAQWIYVNGTPDGQWMQQILHLLHQESQNGKDGATWYYGENAEACADGKPGDLYLDTDDYILYCLNTNGGWKPVMEDFGRPGRDAVTELTREDVYQVLSDVIAYNMEGTFQLDYEPVPNFENLNTWVYTTSTFTGFGGTIGKPDEVEVIRFRVRARTEPITQITVFLTDKDKTTTVLRQETLDVYVEPGQAKDIYWELEIPYINSQGYNLMFAFNCNAHCDKYGGHSNATLIPESEKASSTCLNYFANSTGSMTTDISKLVNVVQSPYNYFPVQVGTVKQEFTLSDKAISDIMEKIDLNGALLPHTQLALPEVIYGSVGQTLQIYLQNICAYPLSDVYIHAIGPGNQYADRYEFTPTEAKNYSVRFEIYTKNWELLSKQTYTIRIQEPVQTHAKVLVIGDSTVNAGGETKQMLTLDAADEGFSLELLGTRGSNGNFHEGRGGWTANGYLKNEATASYDNPFYNPETAGFDFAYYMQNQGYEGVDAVFIQLGINDIFGQSNASIDGKTAEFVQSMRTLVDRIHEYDPNIKVVINLIIPCDQNQDPFSNQYGTAQTVWGYMRNMYKANLALMKEFGAEEAQNTYVSWYNAALDAVQNQGGNVHPNANGYNQLGEQMYWFLKAIS